MATVKTPFLYHPILLKHEKIKPVVSTYIYVCLVGSTFFQVNCNMENTDIFNAATAPLTFHDFLDRMRHPTAADLVRSIKSFIVSFSCNAADPERDSKNVQEFVCSMEEAFKAHPLWAGATEEELDSAVEGLEKYLMTKLFTRTFASLPEEAKCDQEISEKMGLLKQFLRPEHLDIPPNFQNETSWLLAQKELQKINTFRAPRDKLVCILNCCRVINNLLLNMCMATNDSPPGADNFLPVLIYVTIKANPPMLHSNLLYIQRYRRQSRLVSEAAYFFTNLASTESFIANLDAESLSIDKEEFERSMQVAKLALNDSSLHADYLTRNYVLETVPSMSDVTVLKTQVPNLHRRGGSESTLSVCSEDLEPKMAGNIYGQRSAKGFLASMGKPNKNTIVNSVDVAKMSVLKLERKGALAVLHADCTGQLAREYPFLYTSAGDLRLQDVESLLSSYKELVLKYVSLSKAVENFSSHKTQAPFGDDAQSRKADSDDSQQTKNHENRAILSASSPSGLDEDNSGSQIKHSIQLADRDCCQVGTDLVHLGGVLFTTNMANAGSEAPSKGSDTTEAEKIDTGMPEMSSRIDVSTENSRGDDAPLVSDFDTLSTKAAEHSSATFSETSLSEVTFAHEKDSEHP
eukprot:Gb_16431 [translate_table: standard]